jgi:hypothetical protein
MSISNAQWRQCGNIGMFDVSMGDLAEYHEGRRQMVFRCIAARVKQEAEGSSNRHFCSFLWGCRSCGPRKEEHVGETNSNLNTNFVRNRENLAYHTKWSQHHHLFHIICDTHFTRYHEYATVVGYRLHTSLGVD